MTRQQSPSLSTDDTIRGWLTGRLPSDWFVAAPEVVTDREEITIIGTLAEPSLGAEAGEAERAAAQAGTAKEFRERTREQRMKIARELEHRSDRRVAWGVVVGERREVFTNVSVPVMTRLRQRDRIVLDTLVDSGVARSRSEALAWCVQLVGTHEKEWLSDLTDAMSAVRDVRDSGPRSEGSEPGSR